MGKTWVLHTETKGTGAHIAPLKRTGAALSPKLSLVNLHPHAPAAPADEALTAPAPKRFKVIDVLSGRALVEDVGAADAVRALRGLRTVVDALVYVLDEHGRWRLLGLADTRALWALRDRARS